MKVYKIRNTKDHYVISGVLELEVNGKPVVVGYCAKSDDHSAFQIRADGLTRAEIEHVEKIWEQYI